MLLTSFSREGWDRWGLEYEPLIPERMPVLIDDDLRFGDESGLRATVVANVWLRELPINRVTSWRSWWVYARALLAWLEFLGRHGVAPYGDRDELRAALGGFAEYRLAGPLKERWDVETWNMRVNVLSRFYGWCVENKHCMAVPFSYSWATTRRGPYQHLAEEFERRLKSLRDAGEIPDPRDGQIARLKEANSALRQRLSARDADIAQLKEIQKRALSQIAAQHAELQRLRRQLSDSTVRRLRTPDSTAFGSSH